MRRSMNPILKLNKRIARDPRTMQEVGFAKWKHQLKLESIMLKNAHGRYMQSHELFPALGYRRGGHLPVEGFGPRAILGTLFRCVPARPGSRAHRIEYYCSDCERWIPYGRAAQHTAGAPHRSRADSVRALEARVHTFEMGDTE